MQDDQMQDQDGLFARWRTRLSQALLRDPAVILLERDADALVLAQEQETGLPTLCDASY
jgi:hypothetical protein